jgi:hypothetical protein
MTSTAEIRNKFGVISTHSLDSSVKDLLRAHFTVLEIDPTMKNKEKFQSFLSNYTLELEILTAVIIEGDLDGSDFEIDDLLSKYDIESYKFSLVDKNSASRLYSKLLEILKYKLDENRKMHAFLRSESASLREELSHVQNKFVELESFHHDIGAARFSLALDIPGTTSVLELSSQTRQLAQRLPISARGLVAVDILCRKEWSKGDGRVVVDVEDLSERVLATTSRRTGALVDGWNRFALSAGVDCDDRDAALRLRLDDASPDAVVALSLGSPTPVRRLRPTVGPLPVADASLALRVWRGIPNVRPPSDADDLGRRHVRPGDLPRPRTLFCADDDMGYDPVQYWPKEDGFLVHPPTKGLTVGIVEKLPASKLSGLTAVVHNAHVEGPVLRMGMAVAPAGLGAGIDVARAMTWTALPPLGWGEVHVMLDAPLTGDIDIVLASLVAGGESNHMAWALFRGFRFCTTA